MTNVLVGLVFVVHGGLAATQNYLDIEVQFLPVLLSLMYFQYLRHARAVVQKALAADPLGSSDTRPRRRRAEDGDRVLCATP